MNAYFTSNSPKAGTSAPVSGIKRGILKNRGDRIDVDQ